MSQNLVSKHFTLAQWDRVDRALEELEAALAPQLVALSASQRQRLVRMGDGSVAFCRNAANVMDRNRPLLPATMDMVELHRDLGTHEQLQRRHFRLIKLMDQVRDTDIALGSDAMVCATRGYSLLKRTGSDQGLDSVQQELAHRFRNNGPRRRKAAVTD